MASLKHSCIVIALATLIAGCGGRTGSPDDATAQAQDRTPQSVAKPEFAPLSFHIRLAVDIPPDDGMPAGTLFEARDPAGRMVVGAGFPLANNTGAMSNPRQMSFSVGPADAPVIIRSLGRPFGASGAAQLLTYKGDLLARSYFDASQPMKRYDTVSNAWVRYPVSLVGSDAIRAIQVVDGRLLTLTNTGRLYWDSLPIQTPQAWHSDRSLNMLHASHQLVTFRLKSNSDGSFTGILATCKWKRGDRTVSECRDRSIASNTIYVLYPDPDGSAIHVVDASGSVFRLGVTSDEVQRQSDDNSFQLYSAMMVGDEVVFGHYPSGMLYRMRGNQLLPWVAPPSEFDRCGLNIPHEAQSVAIYNGRLTVGSWPFGEVWQRVSDVQWEPLARPFESLPCTSMPYEDRLVALPELPYNALGQRVFAMHSWSTGLAVSTSAKDEAYAAALELLTPDERSAYGQVHFVERGLDLACELDGSGPMELDFEMTGSTMTIRRDGNIVCMRSVDPARLPVQSTLRTTVGNGVWGPFRGTVRDKGAGPSTGNG